MTTSGLLLDDATMSPEAGHRERFGTRWRLVSAGLSNVWRYGDLVLPAESGRLLLRGPNGTGKTTALEALWPFLLDLDKTKLRAGHSRTTTLTSLMREGWTERKRVGYAWLTFAGPEGEGVHSYGARLVLSNGSTPVVRIEPFRLPGEPVTDVPLTGPGRSTLTTLEAFREVVEDAGGQVFQDIDDYVTHLGHEIFGATRRDLTALAERVRTVRNPNLLAATSADAAAQALREALPGVSAEVIDSTGEALAATEETRRALERDEEAALTLTRFAEVWAGHAADVAGRRTQAAAQARSALISARRALSARKADLDTARGEQERAQGQVGVLEERERTASAEVSAIEKSPAYAAVGRLSDLRRAAQAQSGEATARLGQLTGQVDRLRRDTEDSRDDADRLARAVAGTCAGATEHDPAVGTTTAGTTVVVRGRPQSVLTVGSTSVDPGTGLEVATEPDELTATAEGWTRRATEHDTAAAGAELMIREHQAVAAADAEARQATDRADVADRAADQQAQARDRATESARAAVRELAQQVTDWLTHGADLTGDTGEDPLSRQDVTDAADTGAAAFLALVHGWHEGARERAAYRAAEHESAATRIRAQAAQLDAQGADLRARAEVLRSGQLLPLPRPDWAGPGEDALAFGTAVEWRCPDQDRLRDRVESALSAAGVLGAVLDQTGARTSVWRLDTGGPVAEPNLGDVLGVDPSHPRAGSATRVLQRIALTGTAADQPRSPAVVGRDGTFRFGVLLGRAPGCDDPAELPVASHIGAAQRRAAARVEADRLAAEAARCDAEASGLRGQADQELARARGLRALVAAFPSSAALAEAEQVRAVAAAAAHGARSAADRAADLMLAARDRAAALARDWTARVRSMGLPTDPADLRALLEDARSSAAALRRDVLVLTDQAATLTRLRSRVTHLAQDRQQIGDLHAAAVEAHDGAARAQAELAELQATHGQEAADLTSRLSAAQGRVSAARSARAPAATGLREADRAVSRDTERLAAAEEKIAEAEPVASEAVQGLRAMLAVDGVRAAVLAEAVPPEDDGDLVRQVGDAVSGTTTYGKKKVADEHEQARAHLAGVWTIDRAEGHGDELDTYQCSHDGAFFAPSAAAVHATALAQRARERLLHAEESALRDFIVGRLPTAIGAAWHEQRDWVTSVNRKMASASASSGVGVRVRTSLRDDLSPTQRTVYELACRRSAATRSTDNDRELADALKALLNAADGETVTDRVRSAVDVREWVRVDYLVHRPGEAEPKRWTRNTGLSGGERRLVILAPMLAAVAAVYDNLSPTALRLAALDEVPAEVDERGRQGLARYVAELDLDVICTSYLWDGAPGAWDGVDAHDLEAGPDGTVVAFPMLIRGLEPLPGDPDYRGD